MQTKYFIFFLLLANGVLIYQVLLPIYSGVGSVIYPSPGKSVEQLRQDIKNYEASIAKAQEIISEAGKLKQKYQTVTKEDIELMKAMVPEEINEVKLHSEMAAILRQNGFSSEKLGVSKKTSSVSIPGVQAYSVNFVLEDTSYERLKAFLSVIERSRRILAIKSIDVTPSGEVGGSYKFDVNTETYYIPK